MFGWGKKKKEAGSSNRPSFVARWWEGMSPSSRRLITQAYFLSLACVLMGGAGIYGMKMLERRVIAGQSGPVPTAMQVLLVDPPSSMPATLLMQIAAAITPADANPADADLAQKVFQLAQSNPWISKAHQAQLRPSADARLVVVEVKADYRMLFARVQPMKGSQVEYVDAAGYRLPFDQAARYFVNAPADARRPARQVFFVRRTDIPAGWKYYGIHYITIDGVLAATPAVGQKWEGDDLAEGLRLVRLIGTRKYANQIKTVDVRNYNGRGRRGDSDLCMRAQIGSGPETVVRFGRFPYPNGDWEVPTDRKMYNLDTFVADQRGYLAGTAQYVDLRGDQLRFRPNDS